MASRHRAEAPTSELRIIAGVWRGRRIRFPERPGLRPTPNRVRETLFNWLRPSIEGSVCLDLFAGSGALGIEALSRGARQVVFVESDLPAAQALRANLQLLKSEGSASVQIVDALGYLAREPEQFDIVFLDPPFDSNVLGPVCARLAEGWIRPGGLIYIEASKRHALEVPVVWEILRTKTAGQVGYHLARQITS